MLLFTQYDLHQIQIDLGQIHAKRCDQGGNKRIVVCSNDQARCVVVVDPALSSPERKYSF